MTNHVAVPIRRCHSKKCRVRRIPPVLHFGHLVRTPTHHKPHRPLVCPVSRITLHLNQHKHFFPEQTEFIFSVQKTVSPGSPRRLATNSGRNRFTAPLPRTSGSKTPSESATHFAPVISTSTLFTRPTNTVADFRVRARPQSPVPRIVLSYSRRTFHKAASCSFIPKRRRLRERKMPRARIR